MQEVVEADGDVHLRERSSRTVRYVQIEVVAPGHELPRRAVFEYEEWYRATDGGSWGMTAYEYEIRLATGTFGRKAYHWHDDAYHVHCQEHDRAVSPHYRGYEVRLLDDARPEFLRIFSADRVDCAGLHPIR